MESTSSESITQPSSPVGQSVEPGDPPVLGSAKDQFTLKEDLDLPLSPKELLELFGN